MITKRNETRERGSNRPSAHRGRWGDLARRMAAILTATALGLGITVYGADKYAPVQITDPSQFPTIKIETNLVLDEATELPANVTIDGTTYGFVEVGLRVTPGAVPYDKLSYVGVVVSYNNEHLKPITWTERDPETWAPKEDKEVNSDTGEESTVQNFRFLTDGEEYLPAKKADIMDTAAARIIREEGEEEGWTAFTMVTACDDEVALAGDSRLMVVRFAYEQTADFELTYDTTDSKIKKVLTRDAITGAVTSTEDVPLLQWATDDSVSHSRQAENSAMLVGTNDENTIYFAASDPDPASWTVGDSGLPEPNTQGYKDYAIPADGGSTASMLTASAVELPDEPSAVYDTGDDTVYDLTGDTEPETPEEEPEEEELPESEEEEETSFFEELPMLFASPRAGTAEGSYQTNFFPVDPDYIASLSETSHPWMTWSAIDEPKIQFVDIHRPTADSGVGGISLDDVVPVIFFDWDDTFLGSTVIARGIDSRESVNNFVAKNLIHPTFFTNQTNPDPLATTFRGDNGLDLSRQNSYRGVEKHIDPDNGDTYTDGEQYPLTNKLEYVFYTDMDDPFRFDDGWTWVESALDVQNTWTTLGTGNLSANDPTELNLMNFKDDVEDLNNNTSAIYVKATYEPGTLIDTGTSHYATVGPETYGRYGNAAAFAMKFQFERKNNSGYGVSRAVEPTVRAEFSLTGSDQKLFSYYMEFAIANEDMIDVEITTAREVEKVGYLLTEKYASDFVGGTARSGENALGTFVNYTGGVGTTGFVQKGNMVWLRNLLKKNTGSSEFTTEQNWIDQKVLDECNFKYQVTATKVTGFTAVVSRNNAKKYIKTLAEQWQASGNTDELTWFQIQHALLNTTGGKGEYIADPDEAKAKLETLVKPELRWWTSEEENI